MRLTLRQTCPRCLELVFLLSMIQYLPGDLRIFPMHHAQSAFTLVFLLLLLWCTPSENHDPSDRYSPRMPQSFYKLLSKSPIDLASHSSLTHSRRLGWCSRCLASLEALLSFSQLRSRVTTLSFRQGEFTLFGSYQPRSDHFGQNTFQVLMNGLVKLLKLQFIRNSAFEPTNRPI